MSSYITTLTADRRRKVLKPPPRRMSINMCMPKIDRSHAYYFLIKNKNGEGTQNIFPK